VRAAMRRTRSARHSTDERRRTVAVTDEENPLDFNFYHRSADQDLSRTTTRETMPMPAVRDITEEDDDHGKQKTRLRALSESLSGMMGRAKGRGSRTGKRRDDGGEDRAAEPDEGQGDG